ncbi:MAG: glycine cleavage system aminomethyltransferase GcvT [Pseudomonadales bacterium]|nr:glycine cleavage system aminomethyltransferase GcvT [Pseudomonadales bacterium]NIX07050.1 glycine cleavage system aminomethyltransferase GcvT [Pseudomonadales bacterium]
MARRTPLYELHVELGAKMVDFAGWEMPLHYGSQLDEHHAVRRHRGIFDVSHMTIVDVSGAGCLDFLQRVIANDAGRLDAPGQALYGVLLNEAGGVIDDLIVYRRDDDFRLVVNAATREKVLAWLARNNTEAVSLEERDLAMLAIQGPAAVKAYQALPGGADVARLKPFTAAVHGEEMAARTGYTGEDGLEIMAPGDRARQLWRDLVGSGAQPAGLGARDTLRLEAGLNLYGQDMDEETSPLVSNLAWTIAWEPPGRNFIGRQALEGERARGIAEKLTGIVLEDKGVIRRGCRVVTAAGDGQVTSGIFSPTLGYSIGLARVPRGAKGACEVEMRGRLKKARIVRPPFVRHGLQVFE